MAAEELGLDSGPREKTRGAEAQNRVSMIHRAPAALDISQAGTDPATTLVTKFRGVFQG